MSTNTRAEQLRAEAQQLRDFARGNTTAREAVERFAEAVPLAAARAVAAERERIRLELLAEAKAEDRLLRRATLVRLPGSVLRDFARRLEAP